jgi:hypothetical protein
MFARFSPGEKETPACLGQEHCHQCLPKQAGVSFSPGDNLANMRRKLHFFPCNSQSKNWEEISNILQRFLICSCRKYKFFVPGKNQREIKKK